MFGMVTQGVLSRTVRDSAALLDAIIGPDPRAGYQGPPHAIPFAEQIGQRPGTLRIGYSSSSAINAHPDPEAVAAVEGAAKLLAELGHEVEEVVAAARRRGAGPGLPDHLVRASSTARSPT